MNMRKEIYVFNIHYYTYYNNGAWEVREDMGECIEDDRTVYRGRYEDCIKWMEEKQTEDMFPWV